jgi:hypothetical protein
MENQPQPDLNEEIKRFILDLLETYVSYTGVTRGLGATVKMIMNEIEWYEKKAEREILPPAQPHRGSRESARKKQLNRIIKQLEDEKLIEWKSSERYVRTSRKRE